jgi:hypothetical protein
VYIIQLHQHINGITNYLEAWYFFINFFLSWLFISYGVYNFLIFESQA